MSEEISLKKIKEICIRPGYHLCWFRKLSFYVTIPLLYLKIRPTQVTVASIILGFLAAILFFQGTYLLSIIAAIVLCISTLLDHIDGNIARFQKVTSDKDYFLDETYNIYGVPIIISMIGLGGYKITGDWIWILVGALATYGFLVREALTQLIYVKELKGKKDAKNILAIGATISKKSLIINKIFPSHYDHFCYGILVFSWFNKTYLVLLYFAIVYNLLWIGKVAYNYLFALKK